MKKVLIFILSAVMLTAILTSCTPADSVVDTDNGKITVVTTIFPVYDWVRNVAGDRCNIIYLDESGTDMHSYEPTANDILTLAQADVFIHIGGVSDEWVENAVASAKNSSLKTLSLMSVTGVLEEETADGMQTHEHEHGTPEYDEHIWLSLRKAQIAVNAICDILSQADEANAAFYKANADAYNGRLSELDGRYSQCVNSAERKTLLFADRFPFRYLTEDYGITYFAAFPGCSAETDASFETLAKLIDKTKELSLPCILTIENSTADVANSISSKTGAKILSLNSCQSVTAKDIENGLTYLSAMEANLLTISEALN